MQVIFQDLSLFPNLSVAENIAIDQNLGGLARPVPRGAHARRSPASCWRGSASPCRSTPAWPRCRSPSARSSPSAAASPPTRGSCSWTSPPPRSPGPRSTRCCGIVARLKADGVAVVFVSHRLDEVVEIAERVTVLRDGRKVGTCAGGRGRRAAHRRADDRARHRAHGLRPRPSTARRRCWRSRGLTRAGEYEDVAFTLHRGEVLGLTGLLGAGRTELALSLFGMTRPDAGEIRLEGRPIALRHQPGRDPRPASPMCSEDRLNLGLNMRQSVGDNLVAGLAATGWPTRWAGSRPARRRQLAADWVERLRIKIAGPRQPGAAALGRQPAARRAGQVAGDRAQGADPRLAHGRRRHRQQARHLRADPRAGGIAASASS